MPDKNFVLHTTFYLFTDFYDTFPTEEVNHYYFQITDEIEASKSSALNSFTALCKFVAIEEFTRNSTSTPQNNNGTKPNSTTTDKDEQTGPPVFTPPPILVENLCPNDCSGHGACVNSTCICNANYTSTDCSMQKGWYDTRS